MKKISLFLLLAMVVIMLSACLPKLPQEQQLDVKTYLLSNPVSQKDIPVTQEDLPKLEISSFLATAPFDSKYFIFKRRFNNYQQDYYHRFLAMPTVQLEQIMLDALKQSGRFSQVSDQESSLNPDYKISFVLKQLYVDISKPNSPKAVISIEVELMQYSTNNSRIIFDQTYHQSIAVVNYNENAGQIVEAWNKGLAVIVNNLNKKLQTL
ncbi:MAG: hypothetical protein AAGA27_08240 [Pseudomonadota bacterium]